MGNFFALLILFIICFFIWFIIGKISTSVRKGITGKDSRDIEPFRNPLSFGPLVKTEEEGSLKWMAYKGSNVNYWALAITDKDCSLNITDNLSYSNETNIDSSECRLAYCLNFIDSWNDLIKVRDFILERVKELGEQKDWELVEPPDRTIEDKRTKIVGTAKSWIKWEIWKKSGKWHTKVYVPKKGSFRGGNVWQEEAEADKFGDIVEKKNNFINIRSEQ